MVAARLFVFALTVLAWAGVGCQQNDAGFPGRDGYNTLVRVVSEPPGAHCPAGGTAVRSGVDSNRNGELDESEVTGQVTYVCNGAAGADAGAEDAAVVTGGTLMTSVTEAPGAHCQAGGQALSWGTDTNGDGVLQAGEITSTSYVCNGTPGAPGAPGRDSLVAVAAELAGSNCAGGGSAIKTGLDLNGDGLLQPDEVASKSYVCSGLNGKTSLVRQADEPAGSNCAFGGRKLSSGLDANGDGMLQDTESSAVSYLCNGAPPSGGGNSSVFRLVAAPTSACAAGGTQIQLGLDLNGNSLLDPTEVNSTADVCNGIAGGNGFDSLAAVSPEPAGAQCSAGGQRIDTGLDVNRDGVLQAGEIEGTEYVCQGSSTLVRTTPVAQGTTCAAGGQKLETGVDSNGNGVLETAEVLSTATVCDGVAGTNGLSSLVKVTPVTAGAECTAGGQRIETGMDANRDGVLQSTEVTTTQLVCGGTAGHSALVAVSAEPAGTHCFAGGQRIDSGLDADDDLVLDPTEIASTRYVCDGGEVALRVSEAMWGGVCKMGGVRVDSGLDKNVNGTLDDDEIQKTQYACNAWAAAVGGGVSHTCSLMTTGLESWVTCWGDNTYGQLGDGTITMRRSPVTVVGLSDVVKISVGAHHNCALLQGGSVRCWGRNNRGQLGDGTVVDSSKPVLVNLASAIDVAAGGTASTSLGVVLGYGHTCAALGAGTVSCWGDNSSGQLGDGGAVAYSSVPVPVTAAPSVALSGVRAVATGGAHSCAVTSLGGAMCWGQNASGQLGDGSTITRGHPVTVLSGMGSLTGADSIAAGGMHSCARLSDASVRCWGSNASNQLDGTAAPYQTRAVSVGVSGTSSLGLGDRHTCVSLREGASQCWGRGQNGQIGNGTSDATVLEPSTVLGLSGSLGIDGGGEHTCSVTSGGTILCWGYNGSGQLGDGTGDTRLRPIQVLVGVGP